LMTLVDRTVGPGHHSTTWDGKDSSGRKVAAGVYLCKLTAGNSSFTQKLVLLE